MNNPRGIDLRQLGYFRVLAATLHFGRAAQQLHMSQPPLSIQIRQLEERLGVRLFERSRAGVTPTPAGRVLADELDAFFPRFAELLERVRAAARGDSGLLRIGFITPAEYSFLPDFLREFRAAAPGIMLSLREMTSDAQLQALLDGSLDAGFVLPPVLHGEIQYRPVFHDSLMLALPSRHRLATGKAPRSPKDLAGEPLIIFPRDKAPGLHDDIIGLFAAAGVTPVIGQQAIQMQTILSLVAAGLGVAVVPGSLRNLARKGVKYLALKGRVPRVEIGLAWRRDAQNPALERFRDRALLIAA